LRPGISEQLGHGRIGIHDLSRFGVRNQNPVLGCLEPLPVARFSAPERGARFEGIYRLCSKRRNPGRRKLLSPASSACI
jgi:hypothetical protein